MTPTLWGRRRGITAVAVTSNGVIVFGRDWHVVLRKPP